MIVYNVTTQPLWEIHEQWLQWMKEEHIPDVMRTGMFTHHRILRLLDIDETEGPTYAVQYYAGSREKYEYYIEKFSMDLRRKTYEKWGEKFIAFRSLMEVVE